MPKANINCGIVFNRNIATEVLEDGKIPPRIMVEQGS